MMRRFGLPAVVAAVAVALTACAAASVDPDMNKEDAKAIAQAGETRIVGLIPESVITSVDQRAVGTLLSCPGDHDYVWSGSTAVTIDTADVGAVIDAIVRISDPGWRAQRETSAAGDPRAAVYGPDGDSYIVDGWADRQQIEISSGSPCFHLPDGEYPSSF